MRLLFFLSIFCLFFSLSSCKKEKKNNTPPVNCDLILTETRTGVKNSYQYNEYGQLIKYNKNDSLYITIEYKNAGKLIIENRPTSSATYYIGSANAADSIITVKKGYLTKQYFSYDQNNIISSSIEIDYDLNGAIYNADTFLYKVTVVNGNVTKYNITKPSDTSASTRELSYDFTKPNNTPLVRPYADPDQTLNYRSKNLIISSVDEPNGPYPLYRKFDYTFDSKGRIIQQISNTSGFINSIDTVNYTYQCN